MSRARDATRALSVVGAYSEKHDDIIGSGRKQYLREKTGSYSVLLATFHNEGLNSWVTLAQVLWINTANKVDKVFIAEPRRFSIDGDFNYLDTTATIKRILKDRGFTCLYSFTAYSYKFHDILCVPKDKTPMAIFNQAPVGMVPLKQTVVQPSARAFVIHKNLGTILSGCTCNTMLCDRNGTYMAIIIQGISFRAVHGSFGNLVLPARCRSGALLFVCVHHEPGLRKRKRTQFPERDRLG